MSQAVKTISQMSARPEDIAKTLGLTQSSGRRWRRWLLRIAFAAMVIALACWGYARWTADGAETQYLTREIERGNIVVTVVATGTLEPTNQVEVGSELSGIVRQVNVDFNDTVTRDQVLAVLDTSKIKFQVAQSKAALQLAEAEALRAAATVKEQQFELNRMRRTEPTGAWSESEQVTVEAEYERAVADEAAARAKVEQARASLDTAQTELDKTVIHSPIDGVVLTRDIEPGQTVAASFQAPVLFTLAEDLAQMELQVDIDEADISKVRTGQTATFTVDAYAKRPFDATITQVRYSPETDSGVVTYKALLLVNNDDLALRPGMTATATITVSRADAVLLVPNAALRFTPPEDTGTATSGGLASMLLPHPPRPASQKDVNANSTDKDAPRVWILEHGVPVPVEVAVGDTDGSRTAVTADKLAPGVQVIVDVVENGS